MIARTVLVVFALATASFSIAQKTAFSRINFYEAMETNKADLINDQQAIARSAGYAGFEGALLMRKAGLMKKAGEKLSLFKEGHKLLDEAIKKDENNAELRFLRLMIQENAPPILKYRGDIDKDSAAVVKNFGQLHPETQKAILRYSKSSKILKPTDFNGS